MEESRKEGIKLVDVTGFYTGIFGILGFFLFI